MPGMMTEDQMRQLRQARGSAFDRMWLQLMIQHHQEAVARTELQQGTNAGAKALAQRIIDTQQAEIDTMRSMLASK